MKMMPRTKPVQIKPQANVEVGWDDIAGVDEAKTELQEVVDFLRDPKRFKRARRHGPQGRPAARPARHRQDAAGQGRRPRVRRAVLLRSRASSFVEMFAGLGAARIRRLFREARKNAPAIIFIDELDAVGAAPRHATTTPSASRRSTSCSSRWTASRRRATSSSWPPPTCSRSSTRRCCAPAASTARSSSRRPTSTAARKILEVHTPQQAAARRRRPRTSSPSRPPA